MGRSTAGSRPPGNWYSVLSTVTDDIDMDISLTGHGVSLTGHGVSLTGYGVSLTGHGVSLTGYGVSLTGHGESLTGHGESLLSLLPDAVAVDDKLRTEATSRPLRGDAMAIDAQNRQSMPESYNRTI